MKKVIFSIIAVLLIIVLSLVVYRFFICAGTIQISDVTQKEIITLSNRGFRNVHAIRIFITGHIDGTAIIRQYYEEKEVKKVLYTYKIKEGKVNLPIASDWYDNKCLIEYSPIDVKSGKLQIKYRFLTL